MPLRRLIQKLHIYLGLFNLSILLVFAIAGLKITFHQGQGGGPRPERFEPFTVPPAVIADGDLVEVVRTRLKLAAVDAGPGFRRDGDNNLRATYYTPNGPVTVTVLEKEHRLCIAPVEEGLWGFFNNLHAMTTRNGRDWRIRLWGYYNELSIWSMMGMAVSGVYLWLTSRPRHRWAQFSFAVGTGAFVVLYLVTR